MAHPPFDQRAAAAALRHRPRRQAVPKLPRRVQDGWPSTALEPLDLFVYGTLQPGGTYWHRIVDDVEILGPARTAGTVTDTGRGWPAASFVLGRAPGPDEGTVAGTLLRPRGVEAARRLLRTADEIEGEGDLFERVAIRVTRDDGAHSWAAGYRWHPDRGGPPGRPVAAGTWELDRSR